jgi:hypothetical protein
LGLLIVWLLRLLFCRRLSLCLSAADLRALSSEQSALWLDVHCDELELHCSQAIRVARGQEERDEDTAEETQASCAVYEYEYACRCGERYRLPAAEVDGLTSSDGNQTAAAANAGDDNSSGRLSLCVSCTGCSLGIRIHR